MTWGTRSPGADDDEVEAVPPEGLGVDGPGSALAVAQLLVAVEVGEMVAVMDWQCRARLQTP
jgi:hypothetical protein